MIIVSGHLIVDPKQREAYLVDCVGVVEKARKSDGCLDFAISADLVDAGRVNVFERWASRAAVEEFRGSGPSGDQKAKMLSASVSEYDVSNERSLTGKGKREE